MSAAREREENMNLHSMAELKRLTRTELRALLDQAMLALDEELEGSFHHEIALTNLSNIRWLLANYNVVANAPAPH